MKYEMNIYNRMMTGHVLAKVGDVELLKAIRKVSERLTLTNEENEKYEVKVDVNGSAKWDPKYRDITTSIEIEDIVKNDIIKKLITLNEKKALPIELLSVFELFVTDKELEFHEEVKKRTLENAAKVPKPTSPALQQANK